MCRPVKSSARRDGCNSTLPRIRRLPHPACDIDGDMKTERFQPGDQFAAEIIYFSDCIRYDREPEPSGLEGLIDVQIVQALYQSAKRRKPVTLHLPAKRRWPTVKQVIHRPPVSKPRLVRTRSPSL